MTRSMFLAMSFSFVAFGASRTVHAQTCGTNGNISACTQGQNSGSVANGGNYEVDAYYAVWGGDTSTSGAIGVGGSSYVGIGTQGLSSGIVGVYGLLTTETAITPGGTGGLGDLSNPPFTAAVVGNTTIASTPGVVGTSSSGNGVEGSISSTNGSSAVAGFVTGTGNALYGKTTGSSGTEYAVFGYDVATGGTHYAGYFHGNVYVTGTVTQNSDSRLKKNIKPLDGAIDQLLRLKGVTFEWNDPAEHGNQVGTQRGFIAQDVEKVFPNWVGQDGDGFKTLSVQQIEGLEVEAIRTLKTENDTLKTDVATLKDQVKTLAEGGHPNIGSPRFNFDGLGWGVAGLAIGGLFASRRKRSEQTA